MAESGVEADGLILRIGRDPRYPVRRGERVGSGATDRRAAIARAATELFLQQGYQATSTEQIAHAAAVSKQTVYNQFGDKQTLFRDIVLGVTATAEAFADGLAGALGAVGTVAEVEPALRALARRYLTAVMDPQVLALRRLVISESTRFPELAAAYYDRAPGRVLHALAEQFARLAEHGLLAVADPDRAAADFAFLLLGRPLDEGMFRPGRETSDRGAAAVGPADHAVDVFLAAYPPGLEVRGR